MRGKIASLSPELDSGYITPDEEGGEIYFHRRAFHGTAFDDLTEGATVDFLLGQEAGSRPSEGLRAVDVRLADTAIPAGDLQERPTEEVSPT